jgi:hypothetical protein
MYSTCLKYIFSSVCLLTTGVHAQVLQTDRFEAALIGDASPFEVSSLQEEGLLLHKRMSTNGKDEYAITKLDTSYQKVFQGYIPLDNSFTINQKQLYKSKFCLLLTGKSAYDFQLIVYEHREGTYTQYSLKNYIPFTPTEFEVNDAAALIGGYYNRVPIVVHFDFATLKLKILPGLFSEMGQLDQIRVYDDNTFDVLVSARYFNREKTIWIKSYSPDGDFLNQLVLPVEGNKSLLFGRVLRTPDNLKIVAGVYGQRNSEYSKGLFVASINPFGEQQVRYYNFADLENFFSYMKTNREKRVKGRIDRRKSKGKNNRFNYRLLVHELIPYHNQFILLGEAFYPKYKNIGNATGFFSYGTQATPYGNNLVFDGYRYTHATVLGFNEKGNLLWDNTFEINDIKTFSKEQFVKLKTTDQNLTLLYLFKNQLRTKVIDGNKVVEGKSSESIKTSYQGDIVVDDQTTLSKLEYWYKDYLYAYGVQYIVNINEKGDQVERSVFFINKLKCN